MLIRFLTLLLFVGQVLGSIQWSFPPSCGCRTALDIVISCAATIFACIWVALHLDVPTKKGRLVLPFTRVLLMLRALTAPEILIHYATTQLLDAVMIARNEDNKDFGYPWTMTHGFLICMKGVEVYEGQGGTQKPRRVTVHDYNMYLEEFKGASVEEQHVQDKSKADILSKGFAALQTAWFLVQCAGRFAEHLPITELEFITFGLAMFNIATYCIWWHKPVNITVPVKLGKEEKYDIDVKFVVFNQDVDVGLSKPVKPSKSLLQSLADSFVAASETFQEMTTAPFQRGCSYQPISNSTYSNAHWGENDWIASVVAGLLVIIVGAIHFFPWGASFQTPLSKWSWRIGSLAAIVFPLLTMAVFFATTSRRNASKKSIAVRQAIIILLVGLSALARVVLLVQALVAMLSLPPAALKTASWTSLIPHI